MVEVPVQVGDGRRAGPLAGLRVVEVASIGPGPFSAMLLADLGAEVLRIERPGSTTDAVTGPPPHDLLNRSRSASVTVDLKTPAGVDQVLGFIARADVVIEGFRPGVMERLGLGPDVCLARNARLVYGRMTGWGQDGVLAQAAGHDINYIAVAGALGMVGRTGDRPVPPVNLVGDFGGGGMLLAFGVLAALWEASRSGQGQVVDAAMVDGAAVLTTLFHGLRAVDRWKDEAGSNQLDSGAPFYEVYRTADGGHLAVGAIEPQFYAALAELTGIPVLAESDRLDEAKWPLQKDELQALFETRTRDEWMSLLEGSDACVSPVLSLSEVATHPHNVSRSTFVEVDGVVQPAPAPRFSRTSPGLPGSPEPAGRADDLSARWGVT